MTSGLDSTPNLLPERIETEQRVGLWNELRVKHSDDDFAFVLTEKEFAILRSQSVTSSSGWGGRRTPPWVFTQEGVAMLSSVLRSDRAIRVNVEIMRAFVRLRGMLASHADLARRLDELERRFREHDEQFVVVFDAIRQLMAPATPQRSELGYHTLIERQ